MRIQIKNILENIRPEFKFEDGVNFIESGMLDSFDVVTLVTELEEAFSISIDGADILPENFCSIESIVALVNNSKK